MLRDKEQLAFSYSIKMTPDFMLVTAEGVLNDSEQMTTYFKEVLQSVSDNKITKLLLDERNTYRSLTVLDAYRTGKLFIDETSPRLKSAMVCSEENQVHDGFFETVVRNRSINFKLFTDIGTAVEWLIN